MPIGRYKFDPGTGHLPEVERVHTDDFYGPLHDCDRCGLTFHRSQLEDEDGLLVCKLCYDPEEMMGKGHRWGRLGTPPTPITALVANAGADKNITTTGGSVTLQGSASGGTAPYTYSWNPTTALSSATVAQPVATPTASTSYTLTVTDSVGRTASDTTMVSVTVSSPLIVDAGISKTVVAGGSVVLEGAVSGGTTPYTYLWSPATGLSSTTVLQPTATPSATTVYTLTAYDQPPLGQTPQTASDTMTVTVQPALAANAGADKSISAGGSTTLDGSASGGTSPYGYSWTPATGLSSTTIAQPTATSAATTTYVLTVTDALDVTATDSVTVTVTITPPLVPLVAEAGASKTVALGFSCTLDGSASGGTAPYTYLWSPATGLSSATVAQPTATPGITTTYTLVVSDSGGQSASDSMVVTVTVSPSAQVYPSLKYSCIRLGDPPAGMTRAQLYTWAGQHYDSVCNIATDLDTIKAANSYIKLYRYNFLNGMFEDFSDPPFSGAHYFGTYHSSSNYCYDNGLNWEDWFQHYASDSNINPAGQTAANCGLDRFRWVYNYVAATDTYTDERTDAYDTGTADVPFGQAIGNILYIGHPMKFSEANFVLSTVATGGWAGVWEYWNGSSWATLTPTDGTSAMTASGKVDFWTPPTDWTRCLVNSKGVGYWIRLRCTNAGTVKPTATTIRGEVYYADYSVSGVWKGITVPGWDAANDADGDDIWDNNANAAATAHFRWQARVLSNAYSGGVVYQANTASQACRQWLVDHDVGADPTEWTGCMYDVVDGKWMYVGNPIGSVSIIEYPGTSTVRTALWAADIALYCAYAQTKYGPLGKQVGGNTSFGFVQSIDDALDWALREAWWTTDKSPYYYETDSVGFFKTGSVWQKAQAAGKPCVYQMQYRLRNSLGDTIPVRDRDRLLSLAIFYLMQNPPTDYFNAWWGFNYGGDPAVYHVPASSVDIGVPAAASGGYTALGVMGAYLFATGTDTTVGDGLTKYRVYARNYSKGLVLVRPRSDRITSVGNLGSLADASVLTFTLPRSYMVVDANGNITGPVNSITLRNCEAAILKVP